MLKAYRGDWFAAQCAVRDWYETDLGSEVHAAVTRQVDSLVGDLYALRCLQIGGTRRDADLVAGRGLIFRIHVTGDGRDDLQALPTRLPLASNSMDLVVLGHALEFCDDPHALLREVDRVLTLDGYVLAIGFNPFSLFGVWRVFNRRQRVPWAGSFYSGGRIIDWLQILGLQLRRRESCWLPPPARSATTRRLLAGAERLRPVLRGAGAVQLVLARKQSIPLDPLPLAQAVATPVHSGGRLGAANLWNPSCLSR